MKLKDARDNYYYFSGETSKIIRNLGLAGIAVIWLFKIDSIDKPIIPNELIKPALFLVGGLAIDLLQYIYGTIAWGILHRLKEKAGVEEAKNFRAPKRINYPTIFLFWLKVIVMIIAYYFLLLYLFTICTQS